MLKMRIVLFLALVCLSVTVKGEDPKAEPESSAEPAAEPESTHDDAKHSGSSTSETKAAKNPANAPWALGFPAIVALTAVAKFVL